MVFQRAGTERNRLIESGGKKDAAELLGTGGGLGEGARRFVRLHFFRLDHVSADCDCTGMIDCLDEK